MEQDPPKRTKLTHDWAHGRSIIVAPVRHPNTISATFAFSVDLIYDNLASLMGLTHNPWDANGEEDSKEKGPLKPGEGLRKLGVTQEMCIAYTEYRRFGTRSSLCRQFMIRAAAPQDMLQAFQNEVDTENMQSYVRDRLRDVRRRENKDSIKYYASWKNFRNPPCVIEIDNEEGGFGELYEDTESIDALRKRIRMSITRLDWRVSKIIQNRPHMKEVLATIMRDEILPHYDVPLLKEGEEL